MSDGLQSAKLMSEGAGGVGGWLAKAGSGKGNPKELSAFPNRSHGTAVALKQSTGTRRMNKLSSKGCDEMRKRTRPGLEQRKQTC